MIFTNRIILKLQNSEALITKDLSRLARKIRPENMRVIARELLGLDDTAMTMIAANCQDKSYELSFKILEKWRNSSPENNRVVRFLITIIPNLSASLSRCLTCKNLGYKHLQI